MMKMVVHDLEEGILPPLGEEFFVIDKRKPIVQCNGCLDCWTKTPGECTIPDGYENMGKRLSECSELIIISKCVYGGLSPFPKNVLDRCIPYQHPDYMRIDGLKYHRKRYGNELMIRFIFYGDVAPEEEETARMVLGRTAFAISGRRGRMRIVKNPGELKELEELQA